jgi:hypothetical protein
MKKNLLLLFLGLPFYTMAQNGWTCGTPAPVMPSSGLAIPPGEYNARTDPSTLYIPITFTIMGDDYGTGYYPVPDVWEAMCELQADFKPYHIQFFMAGIPRHINNTQFYSMNRDTFYYTDTMFSFVATHNVPNTLNIYIVTAGAPGLTTFYDLDYDNSTYPPVIHNAQKHGIFIGKHLLSAYDHVLSHEVGHYLGLWHTFVGWEGTNYLAMDGSVPDTLFGGVYNPYLDTIYYNLPWLVENVERNNCEIAGDLICDTPPDYLSIGFQCNANGESNIIQTDPHGDSFRSDGTNYMSYSNDGCQHKFTAQQAGMMRAVAHGPRAYLLYDQQPTDSISTEEINFLYPPSAISCSGADSIELTWEHVPGADYYLVEFGRKFNGTHFIPVNSELLTATEKIRVPVTADREYYFIVTAINRYKPCQVLTDTSEFSTFYLTATHEVASFNELNLFPNPTSGAISWDISDEDASHKDMKIEIMNGHGQLVQTISSPVSGTLDVSFLSPGVYYLLARGATQVYSGKFIKQ